MDKRGRNESMDEVGVQLNRITLEPLLTSGWVRFISRKIGLKKCMSIEYNDFLSHSK